MNDMDKANGPSKEPTMEDVYARMHDLHTYMSHVVDQSVLMRRRMEAPFSASPLKNQETEEAREASGDMIELFLSKLNDIDILLRDIQLNIEYTSCKLT